MRLAVSIGCPCGIGPEVSVAAAAKEKAARVVLVGDFRVLLRAAKIMKIDPRRLVRVDDPSAAVKRSAIAVWQPTAELAPNDMKLGEPTKAAGAAQLAWIDAATDLVVRGGARALVTGPVSKDVIASSGAKGSKTFLGHTEHLAKRLRAPEVTMAFHTEKLTTSLVTTHLPIAAVPRAITAKEVARAIYWTARFVESLGDRRAIAVAALNPHAGENGRLGKDEARAILPGIALAKKRAPMNVEGPIPAESAFRLAANGKYAAVVAMYHDQATIPMKLLGFGEAVNVSLGLPIVRTSVDHGTAYDRAGMGTADPRGMREALALAVRLAGHSARDKSIMGVPRV
jgi:4-hydroxythreonine-4-phosphate dehydrogenase